MYILGMYDIMICIYINGQKSCKHFWLVCIPFLSSPTPPCILVFVMCTMYITVATQYYVQLAIVCSFVVLGRERDVYVQLLACLNTGWVIWNICFCNKYVFHMHSLIHLYFYTIHLACCKTCTLTCWHAVRHVH